MPIVRVPLSPLGQPPESRGRFMAKNKTGTLFRSMPLDPRCSAPLHRQLYDAARSAILRVDTLQTTGFAGDVIQETKTVLDSGCWCAAPGASAT
ncbi:MAG: hypothetical protein HYS12_05660 [Planctomycetes bacterium]|nr:hypothetical protein [Planctomycetota bacterium]